MCVRLAKLPLMDDEGRPVRKCFRTVDIVAMEPVWRFPEQGAFTRAKFLWTISDYIGWDGGHSDEIIFPKSGGPFFEYKYEGEEQEEERKMATMTLLDIPLMMLVLVSN